MMDDRRWILNDPHGAETVVCSAACAITWLCRQLPADLKVCRTGPAAETITVHLTVDGALRVLDRLSEADRAEVLARCSPTCQERPDVESNPLSMPTCRKERQGPRL